MYGTGDLLQKAKIRLMIFQRFRNMKFEYRN